MPTLATMCRARLASARVQSAADIDAEYRAACREVKRKFQHDEEESADWKLLCALEDERDEKEDQLEVQLEQEKKEAKRAYEKKIRALEAQREARWHEWYEDGGKRAAIDHRSPLA